jgi:peptidyl-tRNA hydrolase
MTDELRIYIIVRKDIGLHMTKAKFGVQCAHAALTSWIACLKRDPARAWAYMGTTLDDKEMVAQVKIVLEVKNLDALHRLEAKAKEAGFDTALITDAGRTEFNEPIETVLGVGPIWWKTESDILFRRVQLYKE